MENNWISPLFHISKSIWKWSNFGKLQYLYAQHSKQTGTKRKPGRCNYHCNINVCNIALAKESLEAVFDQKWYFKKAWFQTLQAKCIIFSQLERLCVSDAHIKCIFLSVEVLKLTKNIVVVKDHHHFLLLYQITCFSLQSSTPSSISCCLSLKPSSKVFIWPSTYARSFCPRFLEEKPREEAHRTIIIEENLSHPGFGQPSRRNPIF